ncbi:MAG: hypothetical protein WBO74_14205, partial [Thermoanaerobaculia bacterium]
MPEQDFVVFPNGREVNVYQPAPKHKTHIDPSHPVQRFLTLHAELSNGAIYEAVTPFLDRLEQTLAALTGTVTRIEKETEELRPEKRAQRLGEALEGPIQAVSDACRQAMGKAVEEHEAAERIALLYSEPPAVEGLEAIRQDAELREARELLRRQEESVRPATILKAAVGEDEDLRFLWASIGSVDWILDSVTLDELRHRMASERHPWFGALIAFREGVQDATATLCGDAWRFCSESLERIGQRDGLKFSLAPVEQFAGPGEEGA